MGEAFEEWSGEFFWRRRKVEKCLGFCVSRDFFGYFFGRKKVTEKKIARKWHNSDESCIGNRGVWRRRIGTLIADLPQMKTCSCKRKTAFEGTVRAFGGKKNAFEGNRNASEGKKMPLKAIKMPSKANKMPPKAIKMPPKANEMPPKAIKMPPKAFFLLIFYLTVDWKSE